MAYSVDSAYYKYCICNDLVAKGLLRIDIPGAKRPSYSIRYTNIDDERLAALVDAFRVEANVLTGEINGTIFMRNLTDLDADRYARGDISIASLIQKYCAPALHKI